MVQKKRQQLVTKTSPKTPKSNLSICPTRGRRVVATDRYQAVGSLTVSTNLQSKSIIHNHLFCLFVTKNNLPRFWESSRNLPPILKAGDVTNRTDGWKKYQGIVRTDVSHKSSLWSYITPRHFELSSGARTSGWMVIQFEKVVGQVFRSTRYVGARPFI